MKILLLIIEIANFLTAFIARTSALGETEKIYKRGKSDKLAFCVAGLLNQPETAFKYINLPGYTKTYVKFSPFGYDEIFLGKAINTLHRDGDIVLGISIGSLAAWNARMGQTILLNPCCESKMLKKSFYWLIKIFSPVAKAIAMLLGWLAFIPIIPAQEGRYSLALLVDQLFCMGYGSMVNNPHAQTGVIVSEKDEFLDNKEIIRYFEEKDPHCSIVKINTMHARIGDPKDAPKYQEAINYFLN